MESSWRTVDPMKDMSNLDLTTSEVKKGDLTPSMDIFSAGFVSLTSLHIVSVSVYLCGCLWLYWQRRIDTRRAASLPLGVQ